MQSITKKIQDMFETDSLSWFDRAYMVDWVAAGTIWLLSNIVDSWTPYERSFSVDDPLISHPHTQQQIGGTLNGMVAVYAPLIAAAAVGLYYRSLVLAHNAILASWSGSALSRLITVYLKVTIGTGQVFTAVGRGLCCSGRLRPDFLARCQWDDALGSCTGNANDIIDGRKSFPSGHSSTAFAGMIFLSFLSAGCTSAWCFSVELPAASLKSSRIARLILTLLPLVWASWVAITRVEDYRHHKEDVVVGSLIGIFSAAIFYLIFFPNPFLRKTYANDSWGLPRILYRAENTGGGPRHDGFELTNDDDAVETV